MHYLVTSTELQLDSQDDLGDTALHIACTHRHFILLDYLLRNNVSALLFMYLFMELLKCFCKKILSQINLKY